MLNGLDLFSGIGGITLGLAPYVWPVAYCEIESSARNILLSRMREGALPLAPIWDDVRTLKGDFLYTRPDIICGGFPCQDISAAGLGRGLEGERSGLFSQITRLGGELEYPDIFLENVPAITTRGGLEILGILTEMGYDSRWLVIQSGHDSSGFKGERWFCLAKAKSSRHETVQQSGGKTAFTGLAYPGSDAWMDVPTPKVEPGICGTTNGIPYRLVRIKHLGNAVVPAQVRLAYEILSGLMLRNMKYKGC